MEKAKVSFTPCIPGYRAELNGVAIAIITRNGSVCWEHECKVSSAYPHGKSYADILSLNVLTYVQEFASCIARSACSSEEVTA